ncbi:phosphotransferase family protein [Paracoccus sp. Z118]|uniref:phosphotransferase family protein n=1 Tax=Paracoccus sp. Z118 TaxID=2851017 RepID=UPI001C2C7F2B|nr:phosphotransferase family protein [Paracoccus sp. Z118]MBV0891541.1 phosphotransferase family protein [Paracoccus sp. Z118]
MNAEAGAALGPWLRDRLGMTGEPEIQPIAGGQSNPTWFVTMGGRRLVLRKQPPGPLLKGAHAIDREYRIQKALAGTPVPVPQMVAWCDDASVLGTPFYLMERLDGRVWHETAMPGAEPAERRAMYLSVARTMAAMHSLDPEAVGLETFGRPGNYFARQVARWGGQWQQAQSRGIPELDALHDRLAARIPPDDGLVAIAHGDFRIGNIMFAPDRPEVIAVLDWELSTLGHPMADLGFFCMCWRARQDEYGGLADLDWPALGIPTKAEFLSEYMTHSRHRVELAPFHEAFALFRFAVIFVGIADRALQGNAAGDAAGDSMRLATAFARHGLEAAREAG